MTRFLLILIAIPVACADFRGGPRDGLYRLVASAARDAHGRVMPQAPRYALPSSVRIGPGRDYEVTIDGHRVHGSYRVERDSVFFDDGIGATKMVTFLGRASDDTLYLSAPTILLALGGGPGMDLRLTFVRSSR